MFLPAPFYKREDFSDGLEKLISMNGHLPPLSALRAFESAARLKSFSKAADELNVTRQRRFSENDADLMKIRTRWEQALRQAILRLPELRFRPVDGKPAPQEETIQLVEPPPSPVDATAELQPQQTNLPPMTQV